MAAAVHVRDEDSSSGDDDSASITSNEVVENDSPPKMRLGMADVISKILQKKPTAGAAGKARKRKREAVVKEEKEDDDSSDEEHSSNPKKLWENMGRERINPLNRDRERQLQKIATRGVVQLFNAVSQQQRGIEERCKEARTESKKEAIIKSQKKTNFLDLLNSAPADSVEKPKWKVLQDDFLQDSSMKEWDRDSEED